MYFLVYNLFIFLKLLTQNLLHIIKKKKKNELAIYFNYRALLSFLVGIPSLISIQLVVGPSFLFSWLNEMSVCVESPNSKERCPVSKHTLFKKKNHSLTKDSIRGSISGPQILVIVLGYPGCYNRYFISILFIYTLNCVSQQQFVDHKSITLSSNKLDYLLSLINLVIIFNYSHVLHYSKSMPRGALCPEPRNPKF